MDNETMKRNSCLDRYNSMVETLCKLQKEGQTTAAHLLYQSADGFLTALMYAEIITGDEFEKMSEALFSLVYPA